MSEGAKNGLAAALEITGLGEPPAPATQLALLPEPAIPEAPRTSSPSAGGRPTGSRNKRTQEWVDYLLGKGRSPLEFLASLYQRTPAKLAEELGLYLYHEGKPVLNAAGEHVLAVGEAFKRQVEAAVAIAPYLHQKLPIAVDVKGKTAGVILIGEVPAEGSDQAMALQLFMRGEHEENQQVIDADPQQSDGEQVGREGN